MLAYETILKQLSACKIASNKYQEAEELLKCNISSDHGDLQYYLGLTYAAQGKLVQSLQTLISVLKTDPSHGLARRLAFRLLLNQARQKIKEKDINGLSSILGLAAEMAPDLPDAKKELSYFKNALPISYIKSGKREEAARIWEEERKKHPSNHNLIHNLALLYYWWALDEEAKIADSSMLEHNGNIGKFWTKSISYWVLLLSMSQFWTEWKKEKEGIWNLEIKAENLEEFRESFLEERFIKIFNDHIDLYKQNGKNHDASRHEEYLINIFLEKESARCWNDSLDTLSAWASTRGVRLDNGIKRYELIRAIQKAEGTEQCFGAVKKCAKNANECLWSNSCKSDRNRELFLNIPAGYRFFEESEMLTEAEKIMELLHKEDPDNESIGKLRIYLHPSGVGKAIILLEQRKKPQLALDELSKLTSNSSYKNSLEFKYVHALALMERGKLLLKDGAINRALDDFAEASKNIYDPIKFIATNPVYRNFLISLNADINNAVVMNCEKEANKRRQSDKIDDAIAILQRGMTIVSDPDNKPLRDHLVIFYCDRGNKKLSEKRLSDARKDFERSLEYDREYRRAKEGIGTTYNNEGVATSDVDRSIELFRKAMTYDPDSDVVKKNLAGSLNAKGVKVLDRLSYASSYSRTSILGEAFDLFKEAHKHDPYSDVIVKNHNMVLDALKQMTPWR